MTSDLKVELFVEATDADLETYFELDHLELGRLGNFDSPLLDEDANPLQDESSNELLDEDTSTGGYPLGGSGGLDGVATDITDQCHSVSFRRGRSRLLDRIEAGSAVVRVRNYDRDFDPPFTGGTTGTYGTIEPGMPVRISEGAVELFNGVVEDWNHRWRADKSVDAAFVALDDLGQLGRKTYREWATTDDQLPGARITSALDRAEVSYPTGNRDIDDGINTLAGDVVESDTNVVDYLNTVARSDRGRLFSAKDGTLTFRDRLDRWTATSSASFGTGGIPFHDASITYGSEELFTTVTITRVGGTPQTATSDATTVTRYGLRAAPATSGLLLADDAQSLAMAGYVLGIYESPVPYTSMLDVKLEALTAGQITTVTGLEIGDLIDLTWTPTGSGSEVTQDLLVEGIEYEYTTDSATTMRFRLSQLPDNASAGRFTLDDATDGKLDTGILAY